MLSKRTAHEFWIIPNKILVSSMNVQLLSKYLQIENPIPEHIAINSKLSLVLYVREVMVLFNHTLTLN